MDTETTSYVYEVNISAVIYAANPLSHYSPEQARQIVLEHLAQIPAEALIDGLGGEITFKHIDTIS